MKILKDFTERKKKMLNKHLFLYKDIEIDKDVIHNLLGRLDMFFGLAIAYEIDNIIEYESHLYPRVTFKITESEGLKRHNSFVRINIYLSEKSRYQCAIQYYGYQNENVAYVECGQTEEMMEKLKTWLFGKKPKLNDYVHKYYYVKNRTECLEMVEAINGLYSLSSIIKEELGKEIGSEDEFCYGNEFPVYLKGMCYEEKVRNMYRFLYKRMFRLYLHTIIHNEDTDDITFIFQQLPNMTEGTLSLKYMYMNKERPYMITLENNNGMDVCYPANERELEININYYLGMYE